MAEQTFVDLFGDSDSEDGEFLGFEDVDLDNVNEGVLNIDDIELTEDDLHEIDREIEDENRNMYLDAYQCEWLQRFTEIIGPVGIDEDATPYDVFTHFFDNEVIDLLVLETNRYYQQHIADRGGIDALPPSSRYRYAILTAN